MGSSRSALPAIAFPISFQVAAVCYRHAQEGMEFLLVRTSSGRWIFPKGHLDRSLSRCQAASREASEEAGAVGAIEPRSFHLFKYRKRSSDDLVFVEAYLMEVFDTAPPEEEHRQPTWFKPEAARRAVTQGRDSQSAAELSSVIDTAVQRLWKKPARRRSSPARS